MWLKVLHHPVFVFKNKKGSTFVGKRALNLLRGKFCLHYATCLGDVWNIFGHACVQLYVCLPPSQFSSSQSIWYTYVPCLFWMLSTASVLWAHPPVAFLIISCAGSLSTLGTSCVWVRIDPTSVSVTSKSKTLNKTSWFTIDRICLSRVHFESYYWALLETKSQNANFRALLLWTVTYYLALIHC